MLCGIYPKCPQVLQKNNKLCSIWEARNSYWQIHFSRMFPRFCVSQVQGQVPEQYPIAYTNKTPETPVAVPKLTTHTDSPHKTPMLLTVRLLMMLTVRLPMLLPVWLLMLLPERLLERLLKQHTQIRLWNEFSITEGFPLGNYTLFVSSLFPWCLPAALSWIHWLFITCILPLQTVATRWHSRPGLQSCGIRVICQAPNNFEFWQWRALTNYENHCYID